MVERWTPIIFPRSSMDPDHFMPFWLRPGILGRPAAPVVSRTANLAGLLGVRRSHFSVAVPSRLEDVPARRFGPSPTRCSRTGGGPVQSEDDRSSHWIPSVMSVLKIMGRCQRSVATASFHIGGAIFARHHAGPAPIGLKPMGEIWSTAQPGWRPGPDQMSGHFL